MGRSSFFHEPTTATEHSLAILHLNRDNLLPVVLQATADDGYAEGAVTNTRYGSYPHKTLIGASWGSQIRASKVDTGTRGRQGKQAQKSTDSPAGRTNIEEPISTTSLKRKATDDLPSDHSGKRHKQQGRSNGSPAVKMAESGFTHMLQPTPESWTSSLDHRTQVVYVPDYSYILSRLAVKPGDSIIEAGAGSGSFTHAAARAVFNGYSTSSGKVYSFEYHEPRVQTLRQEIQDHKLESVVQLTHRDVCNDGFAVPEPDRSPNVVAVFLDLPAPWLALKHLSREAARSPLSKDGPVRICTFSPCIEQVSLAVAALRAAGWADVRMVEVANRRIEVRRERVGLKEEGLRGVHAVAATVEESLQRLREVDAKLKQFQHSDDGGATSIQTKATRLELNKRAAEQRKLYKEGHLVHRTENEVKTHTSYLVFAVLPRTWSAEDEEVCYRHYRSSVP